MFISIFLAVRTSSIGNLQIYPPSENTLWSNLRNLWHLRCWLQFWQLRIWTHDDICYPTIKSETALHWTAFAMWIFTGCHISLNVFCFHYGRSRSLWKEGKNSWICKCTGGQMLRFCATRSDWKEKVLGNSRIVPLGRWSIYQGWLYNSRASITVRKRIQLILSHKSYRVKVHTYLYLHYI